MSASTLMLGLQMMHSSPPILVADTWLSAPAELRQETRVIVAQAAGTDSVDKKEPPPVAVRHPPPPPPPPPAPDAEVKPVQAIEQKK
jgi:hypothetical protein